MIDGRGPAFIATTTTAAAAGDPSDARTLTPTPLTFALAPLNLGIFMPRGVTDMEDRGDRRDARKYLNVMLAGNGCQNSIWTNLEGEI
jgi:hypothetical protein